MPHRRAGAAATDPTLRCGTPGKPRAQTKAAPVSHRRRGLSRPQSETVSALLLVLGRVDLDVVHDLLDAFHAAGHGGSVIGFGGIAAGAAGIAKVLFFVFLVLALLSILSGALRKK